MTRYTPAPGFYQIVLSGTYRDGVPLTAALYKECLLVAMCSPRSPYPLQYMMESDGSARFDLVWVEGTPPLTGIIVDDVFTFGGPLLEM